MKHEWYFQVIVHLNTLYIGIKPLNFIHLAINHDDSDSTSDNCDSIFFRPSHPSDDLNDILVIFKLILMINCQTALFWLVLTEDNSALVQLMAWCRQLIDTN